MAATDEIRKKIENNKGPYAAMAAFVSCAVTIANLPDDQIARLKDTWPILLIPATIVFFGFALSAYFDEQRARTKVETGIYGELAKLGTQIERVISNDSESKSHFDRELEGFRDRLSGIDSQLLITQKMIEKRREYHHGDTEKFNTNNPGRS